MIRSRKGEDYVAKAEMNESDKICLKSQKKNKKNPKMISCSVKGLQTNPGLSIAMHKKTKGDFFFFSQPGIMS